MKNIGLILLILKKSMSRMVDTDLVYQASALSYITLLSIVPIISIIFYFLSLFPIFTDLIKLTQSYVYNNFLPSSTAIIEQYLNQFILQASQLPVMSVIFSVVTGILMIITIESTFNRIWVVSLKPHSWINRFQAFGILLIIPFFIGFSSFILEYFVTIIKLTFYQNFAIMIVHFIINVLIFAVIFVFVPNTSVSWANGLLGGLIASGLFEISKQGFTFYITYFANYHLIYGALSFLPIFFLWVYISWTIVIFSALVVHTKMLLEHQQA